MAQILMATPHSQMVDPGQTGHPQAALQRTSLRHSPGAMDDLEAAERMRV
jgi:hypothetical protein